MELSVLSAHGLNENDIKVYEALLNLGRSKTGAVITKAAISSSSVYASLSLLIQRGLVSYQVKNNVKYYQAEAPNQLIEDSKRQVSALEKLSKAVTSLPITHTERNEINVYQGARGFKRAYEIMASELSKGEEICVTTYSLYYGKSKYIRRFFSELDKNILMHKQGKIRMIADKDLLEIIRSDRRIFAKKYRFRSLPSGFFTPSCFNVSNSMVVLGVWGKNPFAITIRNKAVIESFKLNFNFLWEMAKK